MDRGEENSPYVNAQVIDPFGAAAQNRNNLATKIKSNNSTKGTYFSHLKFIFVAKKATSYLSQKLAPADWEKFLRTGSLLKVGSKNSTLGVLVMFSFNFNGSFCQKEWNQCSYQISAHFIPSRSIELMKYSEIRQKRILFLTHFSKPWCISYHVNVKTLLGVEFI